MPVKAPPIPDGLIDLMKVFAKCVLKEKPENIYEFAANHFEKLLIDRDGNLYKGYEKFKHSEKFLEAREKCLFAQIRNQLKEDLKPRPAQFLQKSNVGDNQDTETISPQPLQQKFRARKLSSKRPSEILLAIKEEDEGNLNAERTLLQKECAAKIIQRAFRTYINRRNVTDAKIISENDAAIIIQRTLRRLFSSANSADKVQNKTKTGTSADEVEINETNKVIDETKYLSSDDSSKDEKYCSTNVGVKDLRNEPIHSITDEENAERIERTQLDVNSPSGTETVVLTVILVDTVNSVEGESKEQPAEVLDSLHRNTNLNEVVTNKATISNEVNQIDLEDLSTRINSVCTGSNGNKFDKDEKSEYKLNKNQENSQNHEDGIEHGIKKGTEKIVDNSENKAGLKIEHRASINDGKSSLALQEEHPHPGIVESRTLNNIAGRSSSIEHVPPSESHDLSSALQVMAINSLNRDNTTHSNSKFVEKTRIKILDDSTTKNTSQGGEYIHVNGMTVESEEIQTAPVEYNNKLKFDNSIGENQLKRKTDETENINSSVTNSNNKHINEIESKATPIDNINTNLIRNAEEITTRTLSKQNDNNLNGNLLEENVKKSVWYVGSDPIVTSSNEDDDATQSSDYEIENKELKFDLSNPSDNSLKKDFKPAVWGEEEVDRKYSNDENLVSAKIELSVKENQDIKNKNEIQDGRTRSVDLFKDNPENEFEPSSIDEGKQMNDALNDTQQNVESVNINNTSNEMVENKVMEENRESENSNSEKDSFKLSETELKVIKKNAYNNEKSVIKSEIMNTEQGTGEREVESSKMTTVDESQKVLSNTNVLVAFNGDASVGNDQTANTGTTSLFISNNGHDISKVSGSQQYGNIKDGEPLEVSSEENLHAHGEKRIRVENGNNEDSTIPAIGTDSSLPRSAETLPESNFERKGSQCSNEILISENSHESLNTNGNEGFEVLNATMAESHSNEVDLKSNEDENLSKIEITITNYENKNEQINDEWISEKVSNTQEEAPDGNINFSSKILDKSLPEVDVELKDDKENKISEDHNKQINNTNETNNDAKEKHKKIDTSTKHHTSSSNELESERKSIDSEKIKDEIIGKDNKVYDAETKALVSLPSTIVKNPLKDNNSKSENEHNLDETIVSMASLKQDTKGNESIQINIGKEFVETNNSKKSQDIGIRKLAKETDDHQSSLHQTETKINNNLHSTLNLKSVENNEGITKEKDLKIKEDEIIQNESSKGFYSNNQQNLPSSKAVTPKLESQSSLETKSEPNEMLNANMEDSSQIVTENEEAIKNEDKLTKTRVSSVETELQSTTEPHLEITNKKLENTVLQGDHVHSSEGLIFESTSTENESVPGNETRSKSSEKKDESKERTNIESQSSKNPNGKKAEDGEISAEATRSVKSDSTFNSENEDNNNAKDEMRKPMQILSTQNTTIISKKENNPEQSSTNLSKDDSSNSKKEITSKNSEDKSVDSSQSNNLNEKDTFENISLQKVINLADSSKQGEADNLKNETEKNEDLKKVEVMDKHQTDEKMAEDKNMISSISENKVVDTPCSVELTTIDEVEKRQKQINNNSLNEDTQTNINSNKSDLNDDKTVIQNSDIRSRDRISLEESKIEIDSDRNMKENSVDVSFNKNQIEVTNNKDITTKGDAHERDSESNLNEQATALNEVQTSEDGAGNASKHNNNSAENNEEYGETNSTNNGTPKMIERQQTVEETCTKKYYPLLTPPLYDKNAMNLSEAETMRVDSRSTIHDELSEIENMDISTYEQDSLEAMYYSLRKNEIMLDRMQKTASERKSASQERDPMKDFGEHNFRQVKSMDELQRSNYTETAAEAAVIQEDNNNSPSTESTSSNGTEFEITKFQNPIFLVGKRTKKLLEELHKFNSSPAIFEQRSESYDDPPGRTRIREYSPRIRMKSRIPVKERPKSVSFESPIQMAQKQSQVFLQQLHNISHPSESLDNILGDDEASETIRQKMLACSFSEADSDLLEVPEEKANEVHDHFNISTVLETTSTDTDSTIVSAATKIQAGARGFLTRRKLRRASIAELVSEPNEKHSFGNEALGESLDGLIQVSQATKAQESYKSATNQKARQSDPVLKTSDLLTSSESKDEYLKDNASHSGSTETKVGPWPTPTGNEGCDSSSFQPGHKSLEVKVRSSESSQTNSDDGHQGINFEGLNLAARRLTLQRGDAMQKDSTHEEDFSGGAHMDSETGKYKPCTSFDERKPTSSESWRCFGLRQRTMPVQIDSEVLRIVPKHLRKRIKSADLQKSKRDPLQ